MREFIPYSKSCFVCGEENPVGFRLKFYKEGNEVISDVVIPKNFCGYVGYAHGGIVATLLDEAMSWASSIFGGDRGLNVTAELKVRLKKPVPTGKPLVLKGRFIGKSHGVYMTEADLWDGDVLLARAEGKFMQAPSSMLEGRAVEIRDDICREFKGFFDIKGP